MVGKNMRRAVTGVLAVMVALPTTALGTPQATVPVPAVTGATAAAHDADASDFTRLVNPFIGTGKAVADAGAAIEGNTFPGAVAPFGMLSWSPDTSSRNLGGGYNYFDTLIQGFSLTHLSGPGGRNTGDVPILPTVGPIGSDPGGTMMPFSHAREEASPGYYSVQLGSGASETVDTRLTASTRSGIGRFDFPPTTAANMLFKAGDSALGNTLADIKIVGDRHVIGSATSPNDGFAPGTVTVHFVATFDRPFQSYGFWYGPAVSPSLPAPAVANPAPAPSPCGFGNLGSCTSGAWVTFDTTTERRVQMKVAISYVSIANASSNMDTEIPAWDFDRVRAATRGEWNELLSRIEVEGGTDDEQVQFYTALYQSLLHPNVFSDANGEYLGFDSNTLSGVDDKVHRLPPSQGAQYSNISGWDIYRSQFPLLAVIVPRETGDMVKSLLNDAAQGGWLPKWPYANKYTSIMTGDPADVMIAFAYVFGARNFDTRAALDAMVKGATAVPTAGELPALGPYAPVEGGQGWYLQRPNNRQYMERGYAANLANDGVHFAGGLPMNVGASMTLEYTTADFAISQFAEALGETDVAKTFLTRSQNWTNLFNVESCFIQPRDVTGNWPMRDPTTTGPLDDQYGQNGFQEGSGVQYTWMVPHNLHGLFSAMGGNEIVAKRLDDLFTHLNTGPNRPYYWAGNEVGLEVPWEYNYAGVPYKTQEVVNRIRSSVYSNTPGGLPGNDDLGSLSSWYVWAALGMYPETPGAPVLALGSPLFSRITLHLEHATVTIDAPAASSTSYYVQGLRVNGEPWTKSWIPASLLTGVDAGDVTTTLEFTLGSSPNTSWAAARADQPPSWDAGPLSFPPGFKPPSGSACATSESTR